MPNYWHKYWIDKDVIMTYCEVPYLQGQYIASWPVLVLHFWPGSAHWP